MSKMIMSYEKLNGVFYMWLNEYEYKRGVDYIDKGLYSKDLTEKYKDYEIIIMLSNRPSNEKCKNCG
jgi:hypothetical protein